MITSSKFIEKLICYCLLIGLLAACSKERVVDQLSNEALLDGIKVKVEAGMLHFANKEDFSKAILANNDFEEERVFDWEKSNGFQSMWRNFIEFRTDIDQIESSALYEQEIEKHRMQFRQIDNGIFYPLLKSRTIGSLLDWEGKVLINDVLHCFQDDYQFIILDKDLSKLRLAMQNLQPDEAAGVYVIAQPRVESLGQRSPTIVNANCPTQQISAIDYNGNYLKRLDSDLSISTICYPQSFGVWCEQYIIHNWFSYTRTIQSNWVSERIDSYMDSDGVASPIGACSTFFPLEGSAPSSISFSMASTGTNVYTDETVDLIGYTLNQSPCTIEFDIPTSVGSTFVDRTNDSDYGEPSNDLQIKMFCL